MDITDSKIRALVEDELSGISDERVLRHIRSLLVVPTIVMREWDYGAKDEAYPCWAVLDHVKSNTGIAYCKSGFGPQAPWGLVSLSGRHISIGMDSGWFRSFLAAYFDSMPSTELPIWRVFKREGNAFPGVAITNESAWDSTWEQIERLRKSDPNGRYDCDQSVWNRAVTR